MKTITNRARWAVIPGVCTLRVELDDRDEPIRITAFKSNSMGTAKKFIFTRVIKEEDEKDG